VRCVWVTQQAQSSTASAYITQHCCAGLLGHLPHASLYPQTSIQAHVERGAPMLLQFSVSLPMGHTA
jgi:hypothetical protein